MNLLLQKLEQNPIIAAVRQRKDYSEAVTSPVETVFLLCGDILSVQEDTQLLRNAGKLVLIHMDLLAGIGKDAAAVEFLSQKVKPDGIISTRTILVKAARERGLLTVQRFFLVDSQSAAVAAETVTNSHPDMVEIMPGICPRVIRSLCHQVRTPIIAGGMIAEKEDIVAALAAGASAVSTSNKQLWFA